MVRLKRLNARETNVSRAAMRGAVRMREMTLSPTAPPMSDLRDGAVDAGALLCVLLCRSSHATPGWRSAKRIRFVLLSSLASGALCCADSEPLQGRDKYCADFYQTLGEKFETCYAFPSQEYQELETARHDIEICQTHANVDFEPTAGAACLEAYRNASCLDLLRQPRLGGEFESCRKAISGSLAPGSPCVDDLECPFGFVCDDEAWSLQCSRTCIPEVGTATAGASCTSIHDCAAGLSCAVKADLSGTCTPVVSIGDSCSMQRTCVGDAFCAQETELCEAPRDIGGSCFTGRECEADLSCVDGACAPYKRLGETCAFGHRECVVGGCSKQTGVCTLWSLPGEVCDPVRGDLEGGDCIEYYAYCDQNTSRCASRRNRGESCSERLACFSLMCRDGVCRDECDP